MSDATYYALTRTKLDRMLMRGDITPGQWKRQTKALERARLRDVERARAKRLLIRQLRQSLEETP